MATKLISGPINELQPTVELRKITFISLNFRFLISEKEIMLVL